MRDWPKFYAAVRKMGEITAEERANLVEGLLSKHRTLEQTLPIYGAQNVNADVAAPQLPFASDAPGDAFQMRPSRCSQGRES